MVVKTLDSYIAKHGSSLRPGALKIRQGACASMPQILENGGEGNAVRPSPRESFLTLLLTVSPVSIHALHPMAKTSKSFFFFFFLIYYIKAETVAR